MKKTTKKLTKDEKIAKLRTSLVKACDAHIKSGKKIVSGHFHDTVDGCCPIACFVGNPADEKYSDALQKKLEFVFPNDAMWAFIDGFDANVLSVHKGTPEFKLGQELRKKYIKPTPKKRSK